jgi:hypothetical protein
VADGEVLALAQDMTITRDAFLRSLPAAVNHVELSVDGDEIRSLDPAQRWRITMRPLPNLRIALISLERQRVEIFLAGYDERRTRAFLDRFELYFRRAGG